MATLPAEWMRTRLCTQFGIEVPIIQTGMGWVSGANLTAATAEAGGLGFLAAVTMTHEEMLAAVDRVRERTSRPFGVNMRPDQPDLLARMASLADRSVPFLSFAGGPSATVVEAAHAAGMKVIVTVGRPRHAEKMKSIGVDAVIAQGAEGGGHTGDIPTSILVPAIVDIAAGDMLVIAAGGMRDGRSLVAARAWGADGIAMGTRFLLTQESRVPEGVKSAYLASSVTDNYVSTTFDGQPLRVIRNATSERLEKASGLAGLANTARNVLLVKRDLKESWRDLAREGLAMRRNQGLSLSQVAASANAAALNKRSLVEGDPEGGLLPTGMIAGVIDDMPTVAQLIDSILQQASEVAKVFQPATGPREF